MEFKISAKKLIYVQIIYNLVIKFFITDLNFPSALNYVTDVINIILLFMVLKKNGFAIKKRGVFPLVFAGLLLFFSTFSFLADFTSPLLYIWSLRNVYRFFAFFYCCAYILDVEDIHKVFDILEKMLIVNFFICIYEYVVRGVEFDYLGGSFGNGIAGGNGPLNALMVVVCAYVIIEYVHKNKRLHEVLLIVALCMFISAIAELKFFYFELIIVVAIVLVFITRNFKMLGFIFAVCIVGIVAINYYTVLYPNNAGFLSLDFIQDYALSRTYGSATEINRLSAIQIIQERFFDGDIKKTLFGLGMGNAETAQYSFLTSDFYNRYGDTIKYNWFSHAFIYVESGYVGLILYFGFFISIFLKSFINRKGNKWMQVSMIVALMSTILVVYNQTMRIESMGYTMFLLLSIPYILDRHKRKVEES